MLDTDSPLPGTPRSCRRLPPYLLPLQLLYLADCDVHCAPHGPHRPYRVCCVPAAIAEGLSLLLLHMYCCCWSGVLLLLTWYAVRGYAVEWPSHDACIHCLDAERNCYLNSCNCCATDYAELACFPIAHVFRSPHCPDITVERARLSSTCPSAISSTTTARDIAPSQLLGPIIVVEHHTPHEGVFTAEHAAGTAAWAMHAQQ